MKVRFINRGIFCRVKSQKCLGKVIYPDDLNCVSSAISKDLFKSIDYSKSIDKLAYLLCNNLSVVLKPKIFYRLNEGYFGLYTIKKLLDFDPESVENPQIVFANLYLDAGFPPDNKELIVILFLKMLEKHKKKPCI